MLNSLVLAILVAVSSIQSFAAFDYESCYLCRKLAMDPHLALSNPEIRVGLEIEGLTMDAERKFRARFEQEQDLSFYKAMRIAKPRKPLPFFKANEIQFELYNDSDNPEAIFKRDEAVYSGQELIQSIFSFFHELEEKEPLHFRMPWLVDQFDDQTRHYSLHYHLSLTSFRSLQPIADLLRDYYLVSILSACKEAHVAWKLHEGILTAHECKILNHLGLIRTPYIDHDYRSWNHRIEVRKHIRGYKSDIADMVCLLSLFDRDPELAIQGLARVVAELVDEMIAFDLESPLSERVMTELENVKRRVSKYEDENSDANKVLPLRKTSFSNALRRRASELLMGARERSLSFFSSSSSDS